MNNRSAQPHDSTVCPSFEMLHQHAFHAERLTALQCERVVDHLADCEVCSETYLALCRVEKLLLEELTPAGEPADVTPSGLTDEQIIENLWKRVAANESQSRRAYHRQLIHRMGKVAAVAACLALVAGVAWRWERDPAPSPSTIHIPHAANSGPRQEGLAMPAWILQAQASLRTRGIEADGIDLLMISGDFRQFEFDPTAPYDQPLAFNQSASIQRLAPHYGVPAEVLQSDLKAVEPSVSPRPAKESLERWQAALAAAENAPDGLSADLLLFSLRASNHLARNHSAAAVWVRKHPAEAELLLANAEYRSACEIPARVHDVQDWSRLLDDRALAANRCLQALSELSQMPALHRCVLETDESWQQLKQAVATLLSQETGATK